MKRKDRRLSRWRTASGTAIALAAVAVIGLMSIAPAKADDNDWRYRRGGHEREWREHHQHYGFGLSFSSPGYYYSYPSYGYSYSYPSYGYSYSYPSYGYYGGSGYGYDYSR